LAGLPLCEDLLTIRKIASEGREMKVCPKCGKQFADDANFCPTDAGKLQPLGAEAPAAAPASDLVGGRFRLEERLGGSSTGQVFRASDSQTGMPVALKMVDAAVASMPQVAQKTEREWKQLERVGSPAIAKVMASGKQGAQLWVATELVGESLSLQEMVAARGPLDPHTASELVVAVGEALIEAAKVGVVHRDLAPKNVLVTNGQVKLINFSVPTPTGNDKIPGVPEFVAPELIEGKVVDQRSNIYSLGALYYYLLTGAAPYAGTPDEIHKAHLAGGAVPPSKRAAVPTDLDPLVAKAMERTAARRYLTLRQFLDEVGRVARGPEGGAGATQPFGRAGVAPAGGKAKKSELAQTLMGVPPGSSAALNEMKTRQMDVQIPAEAMREAVAAGLAEAPPAPAPQIMPVPQAVPIMAVPAMPVAPAEAPSPWAAPAAPMNAMAPAAAAMAASAPAVGALAAAVPAAAVPVAPVPAAPVVPQAPVVRAPSVPPGAQTTGAGAGKKKPAEEPKKGQKGKFRETMWFKKGDLDAAAAEAAAEEAKKGGDPIASDKADSMPVEDRYNDDGSISRGDAEKYSLKTGATSMMPAISEKSLAGASGKVSEDELIGEMRGGRGKILALVAVGVIGIIVLVIALTR
jgi:serine/threonine-protein kinase